MPAVGILNLISNSNIWLSQRQSAIAQNIANANTPGYRAVDVAAFSGAMQASEIEMTKNNIRHMDNGGAAQAAAEFQPADVETANHSGNTVSLEQEMLRAGEVSARFALGTSIYKSFHHMIISSAR